MSQHQAIVVLSCGGRKNENWDPPDALLALITGRTAWEENLPIFAQWEVAMLLPPNARNLLEFKVEKHRKPSARLDTYEALAQIKIACDARKITKISIVAHPIHQPRVKLVAEKMGFAVTMFDTGYIPLDPESRWWWVKYEWVFRLYEKFAAGPIYKYRGWT